MVHPLPSSVPVVFGEVLFDVYEDGSRRMGGAPFNLAWHLQAFGCAPLLISRVGQDADGHEVRARMARWGMRTDGLQRDAARPTGTVQVRFEAGQPRYEIPSNQAYDRIALSGLPQVAAACLVHGSLALRGAANRATLGALAARVAAPRFIDVNLRAPWWSREQVLESVGGARTVKLNDEELEALAPGGGSLEDRVAGFRRRHGVGRVVLTRGAAGALLVDGDRALAVRPSPIKAGDPVGAGDAFAAVVLLGELLGWGTETTLARAQSFSSRVLTRPGAIAEDPALYAAERAAWTQADGLG